MEGWIKIHRQIKEHWIWKSQNRFQWWIDILLSVNHADTKLLIKGTLIECKRGQSVRSLETWAKDWNVTKKTVKDFFELLQKDSMLVYESIQISTRITVCNYDNYQDIVNAKETKGKRKVNGEYTDTAPKQEGIRIIKNDKNDKKKKIEFDFVSSDFKDCFELWLKYKSERKESYKSELSIKTCYNNLVKLSGENSGTALKIIEQSMANNWAGLFPLKINNHENSSGNSKRSVKRINDEWNN